VDFERPAVGALVVDFDGTICPEDVSDAILLAFAGGPAEEIDREYEAGLIGSRECLERQVSLVAADVPDLTALALERFSVDPSFPPFAAWSVDVGIPLVVVSDGLGLHVRPMLAAAGVADVPVITNETTNGTTGPAIAFPHGHPVCGACGTCKMRAVIDARERHGPVAFVGDGLSDRYGAVYADLVFAKGALAQHCRSEQIPFLEWETFDDVRTGLEQMAALPGPVAPERCPGWRDPAPIP
jgi:HAD superfamily phosphoserine phosphatase-like hydrolase